MNLTPEPETKLLAPETSLIIRTFNEERDLPALLDAMAEQTYRDFEIVVVDSGSFDRTREIAAQRADRLVRIRSEDFTFGYSLNVGIRNSNGRFIAIVSAHTLPIDADWLKHLIGPLRDEQVAMVYGRQRGHRESKFSETLDFERTFRNEREILVPPNFFANNANAAVRRDLWDQHPFDEALPGLEDIEWAKYWMEKNYRTVYEPAAGIYHIHRETWSQVRHRYYREGQAAKSIGIRGRRDVPREVWRETQFFFGDLVQGLRQHKLREKGNEIARFRFEKLAGSLTGIWNGIKMDNPITRNQYLFDKSYRAVVIHGPAHASLDEVTPAPLKPNEVLVRVAYQAVCATDLEILDGRLGYYQNGLAHYPIVPGHEFSGSIAAIGQRVTGLQVGDPVVVECIQGCGQCEPCRKENAIGCAERQEVGVIGCNGGYAEFMTTRAHFVHRLTPNITLQQASLCEPMAVVLKGLRRLEQAWGPGGARVCAVVGAGPIGHLTARVLAQRGHQVTVFDRNPQRLEYFQGGNIQTEPNLVDLGAFDAILEATGDPDTLDPILHKSSAGVTVLLLGLPYARREFSFESIVGYDKTIVGSVGSNSEDFKQALEILPLIDTSQFTQKLLPLSEFRQAWELARARTHLKVMLHIDPATV